MALISTETMVRFYLTFYLTITANYIPQKKKSTHTKAFPIEWFLKKKGL